MTNQSNLNIAVVCEDPVKRAAFCHELGKKGSVDDIGFYHTVFSGKIVSAVDPASYPAKLPSLLYSLALCDYCILVVENLTPVVGECIVAIDAVGVKTAIVSAIDLKPILANTSLAQAPVFDDFNAAKEFILSKESEPVDGTPSVVIDHCFEVKGVGTVALGLVKRGSIKVHDKLVGYPGGHSADVKSIQMNDANVEAAPTGGRVGLALKNTKAGDIDRGTFLTTQGGCLESKEISCQLSVSKFCREPVKNGFTCHVSIGMQFENARIECPSDIAGGQSGAVKLVFEKPVAYFKDERITVCNLNGKGLRIVGTAKA